MSPPVLAFIPSSTSWRRPGSDERCQLVEVHDLDAHTGSDRETPGAGRVERPRGTYQYGPLRVDLRSGHAWVNTMPLRLSKTEWRVLTHLSLNAGRLIPYRELLVAIWGDGYAGGGSKLRQSEIRLIQIALHRLRARLWEAAPLIETHIGRGVELLLELPS